MSEFEERGIPLEGPDEDFDDEGKGVPPFAKWAGLLLVIIALGVGAYFVTAKVIMPRLAGSAVSEKVLEVKQKLNRPKKKKRGPVTPYPIQGVTVNLAGRGFLIFDVIVEVSYEGVEEELEEKQYKIQDALIQQFSGSNRQELLNEGYLTEARGNIQVILNALLESGPVDTVYFTKFLIQ